MTRTTPQSDTSRLLREARSGDERALAELLDYYRPYLALLARLDGGRRFQARFDHSDVVQEVGLLAFRGFRSFRGADEKELAAWLRQILARVVARFARHHLRECRDMRLEQRLQDEFDQSSIVLGTALAAPDSSPSVSAGRRERAAIRARVLAKLPDHYREALVLHELERKTTAEVADRMGRSVDSVQKLLARGLIQMRRLMGNER